MTIGSLFARIAAYTLAAGMAVFATLMPAQAATVTYAMYDDIKDWDPSIAFSLEVMMLVNVYEPLLWYNPPGSAEQFTPALATSWSVSEDGLTWTFKLRENVKFHDGEPFNAAAAKASIERTRELKMGAYYIWDSVASIEAPDDTTLVITTSTPAPIDLIASSQYGAYMFSPKAAAQGTEWFNQGKAAGTGPYVVRQWEPGQQIVLDANADYWGGWTEGQFDRVVLRVVTENATQVQMLKSGEADFISVVPADQVKQLDQDPGIAAHGVPSWKNSQFLINVQRAPTDNADFRRALTHLWDYDAVANDIYAGYATPGKGPIPATMWGHNAALETPAFDIELAKTLIEKSGVPEADRHITMSYVGGVEEYQNAALLFQENARQAGVTVELLPGEWGTIWANAKALDTAPNLQSMTWWPTYPTPNDWLIGLYRTEEKTLFNLSHYSNPDYDTTLNEAVKLEATDRAKAIELYGKAQQMLMDDAVAIFYADIQGRAAYREDVKGYTANPAYDGVFFYRLSREAE